MKHTLKITNLNRVIESGLVNKIKYRLETTHGDFSEEFPSSIKISGSISDAGFIDYSSLTEDIVLGWISGSLPMKSMEHYNSSSIASQELAFTASLTEIGTPW
tara:strand:- start:1409 stop:1717 length:309 start_codon:yes stop_codon:yes gene_type:complete